MPVGIKQVEEIYNSSLDMEKLNAAIADIDRKLSDPNWTSDWVCNKEVNPTYRFAYRGSLTEAEKQELIDAYLAAGWGKVEVRNSEDDGERSGMWGITLFNEDQNGTA